jgi:hypothetical protein
VDDTCIYTPGTANCKLQWGLTGMNL